MSAYLRAHSAIVGYLMLALGTVAALVLAFQNQSKIDREGKARGQNSLVARYVTCVEIEKLKAGQRAEARKEFRDLDRNLRILKIEKTAEIVEITRQRRDRKLTRYAPTPGGCAAFARDPLGLDIEVPKGEG